MGKAVKNVIVRINTIADTGVYGVFSKPCKSGVVLHNVVSGMECVAFYVQDVRYFAKCITAVAMIEQVILYFRFRANWFARVKKVLSTNNQYETRIQSCAPNCLIEPGVSFLL